MDRFKNWVATGAPWIWLNAAAVTACLLLVIGLLTLIAWRGLGHFWPSQIHEWVVKTETGEQVILAGQLRQSETIPAERLREAGFEIPDDLTEVSRTLLKVGNRDVGGQDFRWVLEPFIVARSNPDSLYLLERVEWGAFIGRLGGIVVDGQPLDTSDVEREFLSRLGRADELRDRIDDLEHGEIGRINYQLERLRLSERRAELRGEDDAATMAEFEAERTSLMAAYAELETQLMDLKAEVGRDAVVMVTVDGQERVLALSTILDAFQPNAMGLGAKIGHYFKKIWEFLSENPREANTEGGIFPAIFGTVLMVLLMSVFVTPFGVVAAVYLKEYANQGVLTRSIRVAVNNLAGVPSIVYGVFGLGFFIYTIGSTLDEFFFEAALPSPTFGTGGLFWASLTLALMTLPVVIVSTEEGLARIPRSIREGSLALGATQWETLWRTILPMASPAIMTGMILAIARAAGEVAPLMLVGVVKLAPSLPLDGNAPFLHLDRKFMHLGFHIYDVGFQSPNVEAARPLVYATALLLVLVTVLLNIVAITVRNRLREKYRGLET